MLCRSLRECEEVIGCGCIQNHIHIESQHSAAHAHHAHHHFDFSHQFAQGHVDLVSLDPRDVKTPGTSEKAVLILPLQMPEADGAEVLPADCQIDTVEIVLADGT